MRGAEVKTSFLPFGHSLFDVFVEDGLTRIGLQDAPFDLCQEQQLLHRVFDGRVIREILYRLDDFFSGRHSNSITRTRVSLNPPCNPYDGVLPTRKGFSRDHSKAVTSWILAYIRSTTYTADGRWGRPARGRPEIGGANARGTLGT